MMTRYSTTQINKALSLIKEGYTRKQAAKKTKMNRHTVSYWQHKKNGKTKEARALLMKVKKVQTILTKASEALKSLY